jgi:Sulfotransferase family
MVRPVIAEGRPAVMATTIDRAAGSLWEQIRRPAWVRLINAAGAGLCRVGVRWPRLDAGALMASARRKAGLSDFGEGRFREGLGVLVDAFDARDDVHAFGRIFFREFLTSLLVNRLKIEADLARHPEILDVPVSRPLFIAGLPRSGTTFLHRLMSEDPAGRTLLTWESIEPSPPPEPATYRTDPRIARARRQTALVNRLSPRLATAHEYDADSPEEDNNFYAHDFRAAILGFLFDVPDYVLWLRDDDRAGLYEYARRQMQHLSWKVRADYWVLKAPAHLFSLPDLLATFPDASIIVTHRDPRQVIPSLCSLAAGFRGLMTDRLDLRRLGAELVEALAVGPERMIAARENLDPARFLDVSYDAMVADPIGTVRDACAHFGYDLTPEYESRAHRYLAENPRHKRGAHRYRLEDFGLDEETVDRHFVAYRAWLAGRGLVPGC